MSNRGPSDANLRNGVAAARRRSLPVPVALLLLAASAPAAVAADDGIKADVSTCLLKPRHVVQLGSSVFGNLGRRVR